MIKNIALATLALALTAPALAGTTTAPETSVAKGNGVKTPAKHPKGQGRRLNGTEVNAFALGVKAPLDSTTQHASGKRAHAFSPPNGSTLPPMAVTPRRKVVVNPPPK